MAGGDKQGAKWQVKRDYRMRFADKQVSEDAGVWLQGCCESTHGVRVSVFSFSSFPPSPSLPLSSSLDDVIRRAYADLTFFSFRRTAERHATFRARGTRRRDGAEHIWEKRAVG